MSIPYEKATSGDAARGEITKLLRAMGCDTIGFVDEFGASRLALGFTHRGRKYKLEASALGWARWFLRVNPHTSRHRRSKAEYEADALAQGMIAVNSILRDYVKGMVSAVECGVIPFEEAMLGQMLLGNGERVISHLVETNVLSLPAPK